MVLKIWFAFCKLPSAGEPADCEIDCTQRRGQTNHEKRTCPGIIAKVEFHSQFDLDFRDNLRNYIRLTRHAPVSSEVYKCALALLS